MSPIRPFMDWAGRFAEWYTGRGCLKIFKFAYCNSFNKRNWSLLLVFNLSSLVSVLKVTHPITLQPSPHQEQTTKLLWSHWLEDELEQWHRVFLQGDKGRRFWKTGESMWGTLVHHILQSRNDRPEVPPSASDGWLWQQFYCKVFEVWRKIRTFFFHARTKTCQHVSIQGGRNKPLICSLL